MNADKEKKSNPKINILLYPKHIKENLSGELQRLEFAFKSPYFTEKIKFPYKLLFLFLTTMNKTIRYCKNDYSTKGSASP